MSVHILLVTHDAVGSSILHACSAIMGKLPLPCSDININKECDVQQLINMLSGLVDDLNNPDGILFLTDVMGATPFNIIKQIPNFKSNRLISGLNLPMLLKIMNYADLKIDELAEKACVGGQEGIVLFES